MKRTHLSKLKPGKTVMVQGWVDTIRDQKSIMFLVLRDREAKVQVTILKNKMPEIAEKLEGILTDSTLKIIGKVVAAPQVKLGGIEIIPASVEVTSSAKVAPIDEKSSVDLLMDYRWIDLRDENKRAVFQVQTEILAAMRDYFVKNKFIEIMTPKITGQGTEGGAEVFEVKYYDRKAYLTQSPQLFKQMAISSGFEKVFEIGACYRAEKSYTSRHATEFFALDVELGFVEDGHCPMNCEEEMLKYVLGRVAKNCKGLLEQLGVEIHLPTGPFPRVTLLDSYKLLEDERGYIVSKAAKGDLDPEAERLLCEISREKWNSDFIFITNFPSSARPFYVMRLNDNQKITQGFDLLYKGVEITSGGQREHRPDHLRANLVDKGMNPDDMQFYIDFFEYGCPPHGGFALGIARFVARMLDLPNVRESTFLFRGPDRISP
ncbi:MAG: aspartate--tRNA(Asn) ligase [Firmicutes bacterium]|nr:aspartate--tRNA(Asn) ligase [Bacillota bacterium]